MGRIKSGAKAQQEKGIKKGRGRPANKSEEVEAIRESHPILRILFLILKTLLGAILLLGGILMLITPGQGLLTIVIGLLLMNFPGKRRFEIWLVSLGPIHRAMQWIRKRGGKQLLEIPRASQPQASSENS